MESQGLSSGRQLQRLFGQSSGYLRTWEFEAKCDVKPSKPCQAQQKKQLSGAPGMSGAADEPSGGVVEPSLKQQ